MILISLIFIAYNFDEIIDRSNTNSFKYDLVPFRNPDLPDDFISMWVADQDFAVAPPIINAMKKHLDDRRILGYSIITDQEYFTTISNWMKKRHGWDAIPSNFVFTSGVVNALRIAVDLLTKEGDGIIFNTPAYKNFQVVVEQKGRKTDISKLKVDEKGYYTVDYEDLEKKCSNPNNKVFILCNPHNPVGRVWKEEELRKIADICFSHNIFIVSDEIHCDLLRNGYNHIPLAKLYPKEKRLIVCTSPSKTFNLAANQLSNIYIPDKYLRKKWKTQFIAKFPNPLSIEACKAAYLECESWLEQLKAYMDANFELLNERLKSELPQASFRISEGSYLAWINFENLGFSDDELKYRITRAGVFVEYANEFVQNGEHHIRLNLACPRPVLNESITRIIKALAENYISKQFEGQLQINDQFPTEKVGIENEVENEKTVVYFLRYFGCQATQLILKDLRENLHERILKKNPNVKVIVFLNSSKENYIKLNGDDLSSLPFVLKFNVDIEIYKELKIHPAKNFNFLNDADTQDAIDMAVDLGIINLDCEKDSNPLQRPATFIIDSQGKVLYSKYGHGIASVPDVEELAKIIFLEEFKNDEI